jgi:hypothetical protein
MKRIIPILVFTLLVATAFGQSSKKEKTDSEIRQEIIMQSIGSFRGSCPCPYNVHPDGKMCGRRSAYSQREGKSPICYEKDVSPRMVEEYRKKTQR